MNRREFIAGLCGGAAWPTVYSFVAYAQQSRTVRRVAVLVPFAGDDVIGQAMARGISKGLERLGWTDGKNIHIDYRYAAGKGTLYKQHAEELVTLSPDVILAGCSPAHDLLQPAQVARRELALERTMAKLDSCDLLILDAIVRTLAPVCFDSSDRLAFFGDLYFSMDHRCNHTQIVDN